MIDGEDGVHMAGEQHLHRRIGAHAKMKVAAMRDRLDGTAAIDRLDRRWIDQREFARQIPYLSYMPNVPFVLEYLAEFDYALERTLRGSVTPAVALDNAAKNIARVIERYYGKDALADARRRAADATAEERP